MKKVPSSMRPHIGIFGKRNAGKSFLINALTGQDTAIVSETPGTTTDPVGKAMEILPLGPVFIVDTAGLDDTGELGKKRIERSMRVLGHTDLIILVSSPESFNDSDRAFIEDMKKQNEQMLVVFSKSDMEKRNIEHEQFLSSINIEYMYVSSKTGNNIDKLRLKIADMIPEILTSDIILRDMTEKDDIVVHVMPIDSAAPKGRIILPQEQALRDTLDANGISVVVQTQQLEEALKSLKRKPALVVTDSQAIEAVARTVPDDIPLTTYSIMFSRLKGDLVEYVKGLRALVSLDDGDTVFIAEACTHHAQPDDIGRVKIPKWLNTFTGKQLNFIVNPGKMIHKELGNAKLIVHCGGCMINRKEVLNRINEAGNRHIPITNYGILISHIHGALERTIRMFPDAYSIYRDILNEEK